jgi:signal transduction histidine kinase
LLDYLQQRSASLRIALRAWEFTDPLETGQFEAEMHEFRNAPITGWQFDEEIPAIVHPIVHHTATTRNRENPVDWIVIVLSRETIQHTIFPKLARLYFSGPRGLAFKVAVKTEGDESRVLFSSDQGFGISDLNRSDLVMNIFGPPPESTEGSFWEVERDRESLRGTEWHNFSAPVWFPVIRRASTSGPWTLLLQHRDAPLEASIAKAWHGNLLVASVVLLLLAASMSLVILASRRVESLARLQLDFVSSVSHELRTPLAAILSAGQNINDGFARDLPHYGSIITTHARRLIDMVDQILLLTSMRAGKKQYQLGPVDVASVLESLQKSAKPILEEAGFLFECQVQGHLPPVLTDQEALVRCLQNLIENAAKYSGRNRWIGVVVQLDESTPHRQELKFSVADRGIGIPQSELAHIFQPFYRGKHATAAQIPGTGLGLTVVKQVVTAIGGRLSVTSELGVGSIFTLHVGIADNPVHKVDLEEALSSQ